MSPRITLSQINQMHTELETMLKQSNTLIKSLQGKDKELTDRLSNFKTSQTEVDKRLEKLETDILERMNASEVFYESINSKDEETQKHHKSISDFAEVVSELDDDIKTRQAQLDKLDEDANNLTKRVESLLPGAASAGLAEAFRKRKETFNRPKMTWMRTFISCMAILCLLSIFNPIKFEFESLSHNNSISFLLGRLPFALPIIWLAIYAGRRHNQALRLEEDYAHKEALSCAFEGYKKQLLEIEQHTENYDTTIKLINNVLDAINLHPGRIYEGKHEDITPADSLKPLIPLTNDQSKGD